RGWPVQDPRTAALLNGIAGRSIELCEGLRLVSGQAALQVLPGVLAVGEQAGSPGRDILAAFVLGYDVAGRLASGFTPRPLADHPQLFPALRLLQPDPPGARLPRRGANRTAPDTRRGRAHRRRDLPLRLGHAQSGPAELFRVEIFAAACRRGDGGAGRRRL